MRSLAAIGLVWTAFDWPMPWLDRAGLAGLALALLALAIPGRPQVQRPVLFGPPEPTGAAPDEVTRRVLASLADDDDPDI